MIRKGAEIYDLVEAATLLKQRPSKYGTYENYHINENGVDYVFTVELTRDNGINIDEEVELLEAIEVERVIKEWVPKWRDLKPGDKVLMSKHLKQLLKRNGSAAHVQEFGSCVGIVADPVKWSEDTIGPELNVRWQPSNLRYCYHPEHLELLGETTCGCCTNGCVCFNHMDIPNGSPPWKCSYHVVSK